MAYSQPFEDSLSELSEFFIGDKTMIDTLHRVATLAADAIVPAAFCGLTMSIDGEPRTAVSTDPASPEIDQAQYDAGSGPCLDSFRTGEILRIDSTSHDERWPAFSTACLDHGIQSTASFPMVIDDVPHGVMNLYSRRGGVRCGTNRHRPTVRRAGGGGDCLRAFVLECVAALAATRGGDGAPRRDRAGQGRPRRNNRLHT